MGRLLLRVGDWRAPSAMRAVAASHGTKRRPSPNQRIRSDGTAMAAARLYDLCRGSFSFKYVPDSSKGVGRGFFSKISKLILHIIKCFNKAE